MATKKWVVIAGLGFGDEGKGTTVDWLCRMFQPDLVVRYNGGPQAMHHVVNPDNGKVHAFRQFGSGTFSDIPTLLSKYMIVSLARLKEEAMALEANYEFADALELVYVSSEAPLLLDIHARVIQKLEESRPPNQKHGTTGVGVGAVGAMGSEDTIKVKDIGTANFLTKLSLLHSWAISTVGTTWRPENDYNLSRHAWMSLIHEEQISLRNDITVLNPDKENLLLSQNEIYFEGAQGMLLDRTYGFYPYVTPSPCTFTTAHNLVHSCGVKAPRSFHLGVIRSYHTRHGRGPLPSERQLPPWRAEKDNISNIWMGPPRAGDFEYPLFNYARSCSGGIHGVMMTHLDHAEEARIVGSYKKADGSILNVLPTNITGTRASQEEITNTLMNCTPTEPYTSMMDYLEQKAHHLQLVAGSYGRNHNDKQFIGTDLLAYLEA